MTDAWILAMFLIVLEARRMWAEYRLARRLESLESCFAVPVPAIVQAADLPPEKETGVTLMTAARDAKILEDEDDE